MEDHRRAILVRLSAMFIENGFKVSDPFLQGLVTFDLLARRDREKFVIKILYNIDTLRSDNSMELLAISKFMDSSPVVVGERSSGGLLEDDLVYFRHGVPIMSEETLRDYVEGQKPFIFSGPGGYYVSIDGKKMREIMDQRGYSIGYISSKVGISRRSVSLYENGSAATIDIFFKLEKLLSGEIRREIDVSEYAARYSPPAENLPEQDDFRAAILTLMKSAGYDITLLKKTAFDAMALDAVKSLVFMGFLDMLENASNKIQIIKKVSEFMEDEALLVSRKIMDRNNIMGCPVTNINELRSFCERGELVELIERKKNAR
ncbi:MAG: transcriptional regulator [Thermoplasmata archaeon]